MGQKSIPFVDDDPMSVPVQILVVEDSEDDVLLMMQELRRAGYAPGFERVDTPESMRTALRQGPWDLVIADFAMPRFSGLAALEMLKESGLDLPFIIVSGTIGEETAVAAMKAGAHDYVMKHNLARLGPAVRRALDEAQVRLARKKAEDALRESEERYRQAVENSPNPIFSINSAGLVESWNQACETIFQYGVEEIVGQTFHQLLWDPENHASVDAHVTQVFKMQPLINVDLAYRCKNGTQRLTVSRLYPVRDHNGHVRACVFANTDITDRVRAEQMLKRRHRELTTLYEVSRDISATLDLPTVLERIATHARELLEADDSEVYLLESDGLTLRAIVALGEYAEQVKAIPLRLGEGIVGYVAQSGEAEVIGNVEQDSRAAYIPGTPEEGHALMCAPLMSKGQMMGVMALARESVRGSFDESDLSFLVGLAQQAAIAIENARVFAEEEQRAAALARALEQQRELDHLKDQFIQNVSHELRTPLGLIRGYAELLNDGVLGDLRPEQCEPIAVIARRALMLGDLVENLTAILETEVQKSKREIVDLGDLVRKLLLDFQYAADEAGLTLGAEIMPALPPVYGDPTHLYQVLDNLLANAVKFTDVGGRIDVRLDCEGENLVLEVADTGVGIPEDELGRVFERFYQVDGSMSRRYKGTGLGLAVVKEIIEAHGGQVSVESELGQGTTFTVSVPIHEG